MAGNISGVLRMTTLCGCAALLSGCAQIEWVGEKIGLTRSIEAPSQPVSRAIAPPAQRRPLGYDIEAPDAFQVTAPAIWDGRPTFGEVWISVPDAVQPERVVIRNERTGTSIRGGMFAGVPGSQTGPIRLSSGAAAALGVEMGDPVTLTITALRRNEPAIEAVEQETIFASPLDSIPSTAEGPDLVEIAQVPTQPEVHAPEVIPFVEVSEAPREIATTPPALYPSASVDDGYIEVAQAVTSDGAERVLMELTEARIAAEIQEDFVDGQAYYRVFARREEQAPDIILSALSNITFTAEAEGSDDGTVVAEMPADFSTQPEPEATGAAWIEFGAYPSKNEALAVTQRLARRNIPSEVCEGRQGLLSIHRVFAGPTGDEEFPLQSQSFCAGVAAAEAARPAPEIKAAMAPARLTPAPADAPSNGAISGPVRIKVGESTGDLRIVRPERISPPHRILVDGVAVMVPAATPPDLLDEIRAALAAVDALQ